MFLAILLFCVIIAMYPYQQIASVSSLSSNENQHTQRKQASNMSYKIFMDSVGDIKTDAPDDHIATVPLKIRIDNQEFEDNDSLPQATLLSKIKASLTCPKSSCPAPGNYLASFEESNADRIYVITGSSALSGSYQSATIAKDMYLGDHPNANIEIFDSRSASSGETLIARQIINMENDHVVFSEICSSVQASIGKQHTRFVLEDLTFLRKNGRLSRLKSFLAETFHIVPILSATKEGEIESSGEVRGVKNAFQKLISLIKEDIALRMPKIMVISHCNNYERALEIKKEIQATFHNIIVEIASTGGIATLYAGNRGIVISY
jgi:DegV family protein with EDD domain